MKDKVRCVNASDFVSFVLGYPQKPFFYSIRRYPLQPIDKAAVGILELISLNKSMFAQFFMGNQSP